MNNNELSKMINNYINKNNLKSNQSDLKNKKKVESMLGNLDDAQTDKLKSILSDPKKSEELLNSPAAKALMKKLMK